MYAAIYETKSMHLYLHTNQKSVYNSVCVE